MEIKAEPTPAESPYYREDAPELYWRLLKVLAPPIRRMHRVKIIDHKKLPQFGKGGVIVAGIHNGPLDAALISVGAASQGRAVRWVAEDDLFKAPVIGGVLKELGCIPIASNRGKSTDPEQVKQAMAAAAAVLNAGGTVGIFPAGVIHPFFEGNSTFPFKTGVIRLAIETGVPIVPAWARGANAIFPWLSPVSIRDKKVYAALPVWTPVEVKVRFGKPFRVKKSLSMDSPHEELKAEAARLEQAARALFDDPE